MPDDRTPNLSLPYLLPDQAQKHVTHNEAIRLLDLLVQLVVQSRSQASPPSSVVAGTGYILPAGATGAFAGHDGEIAVFDAGAWEFLAPKAGWQAQVLDEAGSLRFDGSQWRGPEEADLRAASLGVGGAADAVNRLVVRGAGSLLTHDGAGHRLTLNKATETETASLVFQTGWSGRAEIGTCGSEDLEIRTSLDGSSFATALRIGAATGLLSGSAICEDRLDARAGRVMRAGDGGHLGEAPLWVEGCDAVPGGVVVRSEEITEAAAILLGWPQSPGASPAALRRFLLRSFGSPATGALQEATELLGQGMPAPGQCWRRVHPGPGGSWGGWQPLS